MSIEYFGEIESEVNELQITSIFSSLKNYRSWRIIPSPKKSEIKFRFHSTPLGDEYWEEDFFISIDDMKIYLCFHIGSAEQRNEVVKAINNIFLNLNIEYSLEEE